MNPAISVIVPAHNEAAFLPACLEAIAIAAGRVDARVETVVVLNRCTDDTGEIAHRAGCRVVSEDAKNLSRIRNAGAAAASGEIIVTCDADSRMHESSLAEIGRRLKSPKIVGGGALVLPERWSLGIVASVLSIAPYLTLAGVSFGQFWCRKEDFDAIGGFDEGFVSVEDLDFARRLKAYGRVSGRVWDTLVTTPLTTSCRKFDKFGDWYLFLNPGLVRTMFKGRDQRAADHFWYDVRSDQSPESRI